LTKSNPEVQRRFKKTLIKYSVILGIGFAYLIFVLCTGIRIPCVLYELTGYKCCGCGVSRMFVSIAKLDFITAFKFNPFIFITGPFIIAYISVSEVRFVTHGDRDMKKWSPYLYAELVLALLYGVLRNFLPI
jgi:hypothetical protein